VRAFWLTIAKQDLMNLIGESPTQKLRDRAV
jgi:hypothetical protein